MAKSPYVFDVSEADFQTAVIERSHEVPVVVDFWAAWCAPCRTLAPLLERLVHQRNGDVLLAKVNVDENQNLAAYFQVEGIPAVKAIRNGAIVLQFEGAMPEPHLEQFLDQICPSEADKQVAAVREREKSAPAEAEAVYRRIMEADPHHVQARLGLARLQLAAGKYDDATQLVEPIPPGGDDGAEAERITAECALHRGSAAAGDETALRSAVAHDPENAHARLDLGRVLAAQGRFPEALAELYAAAERDRELARGPVKDAMVQIFHVIGVRSDLAEEYRDKLRRVMY